MTLIILKTDKLCVFTSILSWSQQKCHDSHVHHIIEYILSLTVRYCACFVVTKHAYYDKQHKIAQLLDMQNVY
jgi:hypothetical protein